MRVLHAWLARPGRWMLLAVCGARPQFVKGVSLTWTRARHKIHLMNFECGRFGRRYFLIPSGLALMFELTRSYMDVSLRVYRKLRQAASDALASGSERGYRAVRMKDCNKAAAILRLTCLEHGVQVTKMPDSLPLLHANGIGLIVTWPVEPDAGQRGAKLGELVD